ncbi:hypothetical protein HPP92_002701 [Vanilla planifolia]|uniref:BFN domain-containing protein n=1 Tax=Vanilla planifolia TaxID=51239 RepID=A0A835VJ72_VANPL|nr:hypothetical protein HPP92_002701 [Vanilla planifolia]
MGTIQGPIIYRHVACAMKVDTLMLTRVSLHRSGFWGYRTKSRAITGLTSSFSRSLERRVGTIHCTFRSSSDGNGNMAWNSNENNEDFVNSSVIEAEFEVCSQQPQGGHLPDYASHPAIVLKMEDGSDLMLPIIVSEMPSIMLMAAIRNVQIPRPTIYHVIQEMIEKMGYEVHLVRVTKRVHESYIAQIYMKKIGNEKECFSFDLRPSDAINMAVRCKVPIQVNRQLAYSDGVRVVETPKVVQATVSDGLLFTDLDRPDGQPCVESLEFNLVRNMLIAAVEERYRDAAQWRDKLSQLRSKRNRWT